MSDQSPESDYFRKLDDEAKRKLRAALDAEEAGKSAAERKALHFHKCGKCGSDMATRAFRGFEIEECGTCHAVLLDPGELGSIAGADQSGVLTSFFSTFGGRGRS